MKEKKVILVENKDVLLDKKRVFNILFPLSILLAAITMPIFNSEMKTFIDLALYIFICFFYYNTFYFLLKRDIKANFKKNL